MSCKLSRFDGAAAEILQPGETIVAGTWGGTPGSYGRELAFGALAGQFGHANPGSFELPRQFELAVTDRRVLVFARSAWTGRPSTLVLEIDRSDVSAASAVATKAGQLVTMELMGDRLLAFEVVKAGAERNAAAVVAALASANSVV